MNIIEPIKYDWVACNAPDENLEPWQKGKSYAKMDSLAYAGRVYKAAKAVDNSQVSPDQAVDDFVDFGALNSHAFCDDLLNSQSKLITGNTKKDGYLELTINLSESCDMFAFLNVNGFSIEFVGFDFRSPRNWWEYFFKGFDFSLFKRDVRNWWEYFYQEIELKNEKIIKTPYKIKGEVTIRIYGVNGYAALGMLVCGSAFYIGETLRGAGVGAISYTKKITDEWGNTTIRKGKTAKKNQYEVVIDTSRIDVISKKLNRVLEQGLAVFSGDSRDQDGYDSLFVYGILSEFDLRVSTLDKSELDLGIEGVI